MTDEAPSSPIPSASAQPVHTCVSCKYSQSISLQEPLFCRRYPPTLGTHLVMNPGKGPQPIFTTQFPQVQRTQWCGEFAPKFAMQN